MQFEFATAGRIIFGAGKLREAGPIAAGFGGRGLVVTGKHIQRAEPLLKILAEHKAETATFSVSGEPKIQTVRDGVALAKKENCEWVASIGGGSVIDTGKAVAAMMTNEGDVQDYLEVIGRGKALTRKPAHFVAIPTTAGTGSEATRNAVLASPEHRLKVSLRSPMMLPEVALVDPELTYDLPPSITASTGLDALTQLIEPYVCLRANPMTDNLCTQGIEYIGRSFRSVYENGADTKAREDLATASLLGGIALANAGLGAVHGFAAAIGGMFAVPHGEICAALLADVMAMNLRALRERDSKNRAIIRRYDYIALLLEGEFTHFRVPAEEGIDRIRRVMSDFKIPRLASHGIKPEHFDEIVKNAMNASSMKANPIALTPEELKEVLEKAL